MKNKNTCLHLPLSAQEFEDIRISLQENKLSTDDIHRLVVTVEWYMSRYDKTNRTTTEEFESLFTSKQIEEISVLQEIE